MAVTAATRPAARTKSSAPGGRIAAGRRDRPVSHHGVCLDDGERGHVDEPPDRRRRRHDVDRARRAEEDRARR